MCQRIDAQCGVGEDPSFINNVLLLLGGIVCFFKGPQNNILKDCNTQKANENYHECDAGIVG